MELSFSSQTQEAIEKIRKITTGIKSVGMENSFSSLCNNKKNIDFDEIINVDEINFPSDETWLYESPVKNENVKDLHKWMHDYSNIISFDPKYLSSVIESKCQSIKNNIDSRTFTRSKKRFVRPRLEDLQNTLYSPEERSILQKQNESLNSTLNSTFTSNLFEENEKTVEIDGIAEEEIVPKINDKTIDASTPSFIKNKSVLSNNKTVPCEPLNFDLNEPVKSNIFDKVFTSSQGVDFFQNMSPPSLVNSLCSSTFTNCSSTFTNLMENSYIKNDPILREIRDTDYSEVLLQDCESPMFYSITGSCSSIISDAPENFIHKNLEATFNASPQKKNFSTTIIDRHNKILNSTFVTEENEDQLNVTYCKEDDNDETLCDESNKTIIYDNDFEETKLLNCTMAQKEFSTNNKSKEELNLLSGPTTYETVVSRNTFNSGTYVRNKSSSENTSPNTNTYRKSTLQQSNTFRKTSSPLLNATFQKSPSNNQHPNHLTRGAVNGDIDDLNKRATIETDNDTTVIITKETDDAKIRRFSYILDDVDVLRNYLSPDNINETRNLKRDSVGPFGGSEDSLDQMSSLSSSSKGSNKMLNMADVDAIVQQQERSLNDISTPKPNSRHMKEVWNGDTISPIISSNLQRDQTASDSEIERENFSPVVSSNVKLTSVGSDTSLLAARSRQRLNAKTADFGKLSGQGDTFPVPPETRRNLSNKNIRETARSELRGSYTNLRGSQTNLNSMPRPLKGSYTNLNPVCANLITSASRSKSTANVLEGKQMDLTKTFDENRLQGLRSNKEGQQVKNLVSQPSSKSSQVRPSGLPRPVSMYGTGIPRPVSKTPASRSNLRPLSSKSVAR